MSTKWRWRRRGVGHDLVPGLTEQGNLVQVVTEKGIVVEISSASRDAIVAQLHRQNDEGMALPALRAFERAGASGRVSLDGFGGAAVIDAIRNLAEKPGGPHHLGAGVGELQRTLMQEFHRD